jgi:hypothetical protein
MIMMQQPCVVFNSHDVGRLYGNLYRMMHTVHLRQGATAMEVAGRIKSLQSYPGYLRNIIFNCHGHHGKVSIGGVGNIGIQIPTVGAFSVLNSLNLGTIWLASCDAAEGADGKLMCQLLAQHAGTQVIASDADQAPSPWEVVRLETTAFNQIDDFRGTIYSFTPAGGMRIIRNPSDSVWTIKT